MPSVFMTPELLLNHERKAAIVELVTASWSVSSGLAG